MKVKVIKAYRDKYSHAVCKEDAVLEVAKKRMDEINKAAGGPFVETYTEPQAEQGTPEDIPEDIPEGVEENKGG